MNIARSATLLPCFSAFLPLLSPSSVAAPLVAARAPTSTLSFDLTTRVAAGAGQQQTIDAKVFLSGGAARVQSSSGGTPLVVLFTPPYIYRLLPGSKAGVRWKIPASKPSTYAELDPQQLLRDPAKIKAAMLRGGAKSVGKGVLGGAPVEILEAKNFGGRGQNAKLWLRRSDSLPLRLEASGKQFKIVASWRNYARPRLAATLFKAPSNYRVRTLNEAPPFSGL